MRRLGLPLGAAFLLLVVGLVVRRRVTRIAVSGHSMAPTLHDGDWLLVDTHPRVARRGDIVVAHDPRATDRLIVKRVASVSTDHEVLLVSDHPAHAGEVIGSVGPSAVLGRAWLRYWPPTRAGRIARASPLDGLTA